LRTNETRSGYGRPRVPASLLITAAVLIAACSSSQISTGPAPMTISIDAIEIPAFISRDRTIPIEITVRGELENTSAVPIEVERITIDQIRMLPITVESSSRVVRRWVDAGQGMSFDVPVRAYITTAADFPSRWAEVRGVVYLGSGQGYPFLVRVQVRL